MSFVQIADQPIQVTKPHNRRALRAKFNVFFQAEGKSGTTNELLVLLDKVLVANGYKHSAEWNLTYNGRKRQFQPSVANDEYSHFEVRPLRLSRSRRTHLPVYKSRKRFTAGGQYEGIQVRLFVARSYSPHGLGATNRLIVSTHSLCEKLRQRISGELKPALKPLGKLGLQDADRDDPNAPRDHVGNKRHSIKAA